MDLHPATTPESASALVAITGVGAVGTFGVGRAALSAALAGGSVAAAPVALAAPGVKALPAVRAAQPRDLPWPELLPGKGLRALNAESRYAIVAATLALRDAGLEASFDDSCAIVVGSQFAGFDDYDRFHLEGLVWGPQRALPTQGINSGANTAAAQLAARYQLRGPNLTFCGRRVSATVALLEAAALVRSGRVRAAVVIGVELWSHHRALGAGRGPDAPPPAEGAAAVVIEWSAAAAGRHRPGALLSGHGQAFGGPETGRAAARRAVAAALVGRGAIDLVVESAGPDLAEQAIERAGARDAVVDPHLRFVSPTAVLGDHAGATGAWQVAAAALALTGEWAATPGLAAPPRRVLVVTADARGAAAAALLERLAAPQEI